jgi:hypothetical protein
LLPQLRAQGQPGSACLGCNKLALDAAGGQAFECRLAAVVFDELA